MVIVNWKSDLTFVAETPTGQTLLMDAYAEEGRVQKGPTPMECLLASIASCSAMDVLSILEKKRQVVKSYRIEIDGVRGPEGVYPRPYVSMEVRHIVSGDNIDPVAVERAVQLSDEKYCSVLATLRANAKIVSTWAVE